MSEVLKETAKGGKMPDEKTFLSTLLGELMAHERIYNAKGERCPHLVSAVRMVVKRQAGLKE